MEVFNDEKFLYLHNATLDFDWISKHGKKIEVIANDLILLALKNGMMDHSIDEDLKSRLDGLMENYDSTIKQSREKMFKFLGRKSEPSIEQKIRRA